MTAKTNEEQQSMVLMEPNDVEQLQATEEQTVRKSERARTLTEKGKEFQEEKLKGLQHRYAVVFEKWRYEARLSKVMLRKEASESELNELIYNINVTCKDVQAVYEQIRQIDTPNADTRRKVDACSSLSAFIIKQAQKYLKGQEDEEPWPDFGSCLGSESSKSRSKSQMSKSSSSQCRSQTAKKVEAEAEAAASKEVLAVMEEQEKEAAELQKLELEHFERQQAMEEQRRKIERLEEVKKLNAAKARVKVYDDAENISENQSVLQSVKAASDSQALPNVFRRSLQALDTSQVLYAEGPTFNPHFAPVKVQHDVGTQPLSNTSQKLNASSPPFVPQAPQGSQVVPQPHPNSDLVGILAEAISANRLPTPEPALFTGDPLQFKDWQLSFETLIERKNIPKNERLYYLRKYLGGAAKRAVEGFLLVGTDEAYDSAWKVLEKRFGDLFTIGKCFRDKLYGWNKISSKDGSELREFADFLGSCEAAMPYIKALEVLNDCMEIQRLLLKLPDWLTTRWNRMAMKIRRTSNGEYPSFHTFVEFVSTEADLACDPIASIQALKGLDTSKVKYSRNQSIQAKTLTTNSSPTTNSGLSTNSSHVASSGHTNTVTCLFCKKNGHALDKCFRFIEKTVQDRIKFVQSEKLCFGCLKVGHLSKKCEKRNTCEKCQRKHPTCLHDDNFVVRKKTTPAKNDDNVQDKDKTDDKVEDKPTAAVSNKVTQENPSTLTSSIIPVWVSSTSQPDKEVLVYALLDSQSDTSFILDEVAQDLDTVKSKASLQLSTMAAKSTVIPCEKLVNLQVRGYKNEKKITLPPVYTREFIPVNRSHIPTSETASQWPHLERLADKLPPMLNCEVGLLIGYNCQQALLPREVLSGKGNQPYAQLTDLGWSIVGCSSQVTNHSDAIGTSHRIVVCEVSPTLSTQVKVKQQVHFVCRTQVKEVSPIDVIKALESDFSEHVTDDNPVSQEDIMFMSKVTKGIRQKEDGYYELPLPFKTDNPNLPNNKQYAEHRLSSLERRLKKDEKYYKDYVNFMNDIITRGDAEKVPEQELDKRSAWYIPHHGVYHPHKPEKIRVVFDCSARFQEASLNDHLLTGPDLINTLVGVLCRFRKGPIAFMCDVERMFHQFHVVKEHQDYLRFLWWDKGDLNSEPTVYRMKVHLFGAASSPGCCNFGLKHLASQGKDKFSKDTVKFIQRGFYVDDGLASVASTAEAIKLVEESRALCKTGNLHLHKFVSNNKKVLAAIPQQERAQAKDQDMALGEPHIERALGVQWCVEADEFQFRVQVKDNPLTRRGVLSTVASVYDPLGFVAPFILIGKQILQKLCKEKVNWDDDLPDHILPQWEAWLRDLPKLAALKIPRSYSQDIDVIQYELHNFSDASFEGYGACSYLRAIGKEGQISCSLVLGKARVTPIKQTTIPRLELSSAVTSVRNADVVKQELEIENLKEFYWTDSQVVLAYISNDAKRFHTFVANRIQRIRQSTHPEQWQHVSSENNPADHASRGLTAIQLKESNWLKGPVFLWEKELPVKEETVGEIEETDPEVRKGHTHTIKSKEENPLLERLKKFSDWSRAVKAIARLKRFIKEYKGHQKRTNKTTDLEERKNVEMFIIKQVQSEAFSEEIKKIRTQKENTSNKHDRLRKLNAFLDNSDILRVGGRLSQSTLHYNVKHPAILPKDSHVSALLVKHHHERVHHQGRGMTVNELRAAGIWILGCGSIVSSHIYRCVKCRKYRKPTSVQQMADLPDVRSETAPPFTYCGVDCFGPFLVKEGRKEVKRYGLLFTCLCSRAVHIETLDDLSTDAFMNALRTLIAIRGSVRQLRCDQGTNFMGARREFSELMKDMDQEPQKAIGCEFVMNVPSASHMGGIWERQIRTVRSILTAMLDKTSSRLDTTSLRTLLYETMAIINSRPLSIEYLNDPTSPEPLTPNHILTMKSSVIFPPPGQFCKDDLYLNKRWRKVQFLANEFWQRWRREYLLNLQQRQKWQKVSRNLQVNDIVILQDDNAPRCKWKLARITETLESPDGKVRKVKLKTSETVFDKGKTVTRIINLERPIHKVVTLLEVDTKTDKT